uniref:Chromosome 14 open reading frame 119 n=1 Tax=Oncorhynchus kisutch TaxID=8019 RepID=A0A8C7FTZ3_ONCKI
MLSDREPLPLSYVTLQEQRCVLRWFLPRGNLCTLFELLYTLQVKDSPPNIFECQLRLWSQWFELWSEKERNSFLHILEERDLVFVAYFYRGVAGTAGRDGGIRKILGGNWSLTTMTIIHYTSTCPVCVSFMPATEETEECAIMRGNSVTK